MPRRLPAPEDPLRKATRCLLTHARSCCAELPSYCVLSAPERMEASSLLLCDQVIEELNITPEQFVDVCILCGCDYTDSIRGTAAASSAAGGASRLLPLPPHARHTRCSAATRVIAGAGGGSSQGSARPKRCSSYGSTRTSRGFWCAPAHPLEASCARRGGRVIRTPRWRAARAARLQSPRQGAPPGAGPARRACGSGRRRRRRAAGRGRQEHLRKQSEKSDKGSKYVVPEPFLFNEARALFMSPDVIDVSTLPEFKARLHAAYAQERPAAMLGAPRRRKALPRFSADQCGHAP